MLATDSYTDTSGCTEPAHYSRVDLYQSFITSFIPATGADAGVGGDAGTETKSGGGCDAGAGAGSSSVIAMLALVGALAFARRRR